MEFWNAYTETLPTEKPAKADSKRLRNPAGYGKSHSNLYTVNLSCITVEPQGALRRYDLKSRRFEDKRGALQEIHANG